MDWPPGTTFPSDCEKHMDALIDGCGGGNSNPMNWKHGGTFSNGKISYHVTPTKDRYVHGQCAVHVHEKETWSGVDGPGTSRTWHFWVDVTAKDFSGKTIGGTDGQVGAGDGNPAIVKGLYYEDLSLTPEARGDYIQFNLGSQSWTTKDEACNVGGFDSNYSPAGRDMDCFFDC